MKSSLLGMYIFIVILLFPNLGLGKNKIKENSYLLISQCFEKIAPEKESSVRPIFEAIRSNINPNLTSHEIIILKKWVDDKKEYVRLMTESIEINHIQFPAVDISTMELPQFTELRDIMTLLLAKAKISIRANNKQESIDNILDVIKYGEMIRFAQNNSLVGYMIAISIENTGLKWLQNTLCNVNFTNKILEYLLIKVDEKKLLDEAFIKSMNDELNLYVIPSFSNIAQQIEPIITKLDIDNKILYNNEQTINLFKSLFQTVIKNATVPWAERNKQYFLAIEEERKRIPSEFENFIDFLSENNGCGSQFDINNMEQVQKWKKMEAAAKGKSNVLGNLLYLESFLNFDSFYRRSVEFRTNSNITRTQIALKLFKNKFGRYPESLDELVENKILMQIPLDLFSNRPLNYTSTDHKLWSIGYNEVNDNADTKKDIVFSCAISGHSKSIKPCN